MQSYESARDDYAGVREKAVCAGFSEDCANKKMACSSARGLLESYKSVVDAYRTAIHPQCIAWLSEGHRLVPELGQNPPTGLNKYSLPWSVIGAQMRETGSWDWKPQCLGSIDCWASAPACNELERQLFSDGMDVTRQYISWKASYERCEETLAACQKTHTAACQDELNGKLQRECKAAHDEMTRDRVRPHFYWELLRPRCQAIVAQSSFSSYTWIREIWMLPPDNRATQEKDRGDE